MTATSRAYDQALKRLGTAIVAKTILVVVIGGEQECVSDGGSRR